MEALKNEVAELKREMVALQERLQPMLKAHEDYLKKQALNRAAYLRKKAGRAAAVAGKLRNLDCCCLNPKGKDVFMGRDRRLDEFIPVWAAKCVEFGKKNKPDLFIQWLAWKWNCDTYLVKPITSGQGYFWKMYGWESASEGKKPMRSKYTELAMFGRTPRLSFTRLQADAFQEAPWWRWSWAILNRVRCHVEDELLVWGDLPEHFRRVVGLMCGGYGQVQLRKELIWDQNDNATILSKTYRIAKPGLELGWKSVMRGLKASREPALVEPLPANETNSKIV